jgi:hypothetical protein
MLLGKKQLYVQQPSSFYFPELPQRQFYERSEFPWIADVENAIPAMQEELRAVLADGQDFAPYVEASSDRPRAANPLINDPSWGAFYFWRNGEKVEANASRCPATMAALDLAPMPRIDKRSPIALWSLLKPGTHIQPHHGLLNTRLICHIPLIVPDDCAIRVGNETRAFLTTASNMRRGITARIPALSCYSKSGDRRFLPRNRLRSPPYSRRSMTIRACPKMQDNGWPREMAASGVIKNLPVALDNTSR